MEPLWRLYGQDSIPRRARSGHRVARAEEGEDAPNLGGGAGDDDLGGGRGVELQRAPDGGGGEGVAVDEAELPPLEEGEEVLAAAGGH